MGIGVYMVIKFIIIKRYARKFAMQHGNFILEIHKKLTFKMYVQKIEHPINSQNNLFVCFQI